MISMVSEKAKLFKSALSRAFVRPIPGDSSRNEEHSSRLAYPPRCRLDSTSKLDNIRNLDGVSQDENQRIGNHRKDDKVNRFGAQPTAQ